MSDIPERASRRLDQASDQLTPEQSHSGPEIALVVIGALLVGYYAGWVFADIANRFGLMVVIVVGTGVLLYNRPSLHSMGATVCNLLALVTVLIPPVVWGPYLTAWPSLTEPLPLIFSAGDFRFALIFVVLAAILWGLGRLILWRGNA